MHSNALDKPSNLKKSTKVFTDCAATPQEGDNTIQLVNRRGFLSRLSLFPNQPKDKTKEVSVSGATNPVKKHVKNHQFNILRKLQNVSKNISLKSKTKQKRRQPDGDNLSVSQTSLLDIDLSDEETGNLSTNANNTIARILPIQPPSNVLHNQTYTNIGLKEAIEMKSESTVLKIFDTSSTGRGATNIKPMQCVPHNTSEVAITKVSVASLLCHPDTQQTSSHGTVREIITTTSSHQTRRKVKTNPINNTHDETIDRAHLKPIICDDNFKSEVNLNDLQDHREELGDLSDTESIEPDCKSNIQVDLKVWALQVYLWF